MKKFQKNFLKRHISFNCFEQAQWVYIYESLLRKTREFSENLIVKISLNNFGQIVAKLLRILLGSSNCIICSKGEKSFCTSHKLSCNQEAVCLLACEKLEHKGEGSQGVFKDCKRFTRIVENLKWVYLRTGRRHEKWPNQIEFTILSSLISVILLQFTLSCAFKRTLLNWLLLLLLHYESVIYLLKRGLKLVSGRIF